ncbi:MAG: proline--tRNA ligase [Bacteriovoracaceae bacterium]
MRLSRGFWQTFKEAPADATIPSHQLMVRAGLIHKSGAGIYNYLPIGLRAIQKVENIIREELNKDEGYEVTMSVVTPGELWQESGRWDAMGALMLKTKDRAGRDLCISPTNEEAVVDIFKKSIQSYKQLPVTLYQINTKFRDEIRPRFGVMRGREFTMKDAYSFHADWECLEEGYKKMYKAYERIFSRIGLNFIAVEADAGAMADGKQKTHEFQVLANSGEDKVIKCEATGYAANIERAETQRPKLDFDMSSPEIKEVSTPGTQTIEEVCELLKYPQHRSLKSLVYSVIRDDQEEFVLAVLLGDDELNEIKLNLWAKADHIKPATDNQIVQLGLEKGYIGPHQIKTNNIKILIDREIDLDAAYCTGANKKDFHITGFIPSRDLSEIETVDLRLSKAGDIHSINGKEGEVEQISGVEVGHVFQLGDKYSKAMNATILDKNGKAVHPFMGCYGIGTTRTVAAAIEQSHDEDGIIWPLSIAPYHVHFCTIVKSEEMNELGDEIYKEMLSKNIEVLYDDRPKLGPGFKFKDADLLGLPVRVVLGERDYKKDQLLEIKLRKSKEVIKVSKEDLIPTLIKTLGELK